MQEDVRRWFDRRTSRASDWKTSGLVDVKGDTTVSVVLPCYAATPLALTEE